MFIQVVFNSLEVVTTHLKVKDFCNITSRAVGETMIVVIAAGQQPRLSVNPFQTVETMTAYMAQISGGASVRGSLNYKTLYVVGAILFLITLALNVVRHWIANRYKEKY